MYTSVLKIVPKYFKGAVILFVPTVLAGTASLYHSFIPTLSDNH